MIRVLLLVMLVAAPPAASADDATIRVRLLDRERPTSVVIQAESGALELFVDGRVEATIQRGGRLVVESSAGRIIARTDGTRSAGSRISVRPAAPGHLRLIAGRISRGYRGALEVGIESGALSLINVVSLDDYIASVVPAEYPFPEIEGVKAQAVLVRTYALRSRGRYGTHDVVDHVGSQVYNGIESETPLARQAADLTRGQVLTYRGELIEAVYFSSSGGHTADNEAVWDGTPKPYLRGRPDPYDHASPLHTWTETVDRGRLLAALSRAYGFRVTGFSVAASSAEGRVTALRILGDRERVEQANRFRLTVNGALGRQVLKSTFFSVQRQGERYVFSGRGFGHGVGMGQFGARQQALLGRSYDEILGFYFTGVTLEGLDLRDPGRPLIADTAPVERLQPMPPRPASTRETRIRSSRTGW